MLKKLLQPKFSPTSAIPEAFSREKKTRKRGLEPGSPATERRPLPAQATRADESHNEFVLEVAGLRGAYFNDKEGPSLQKTYGALTPLQI